MNGAINTKAKYWTAVGYPENMVSNWQNCIGDLLQLPYAYCIHDKDKDDKGQMKKTHVHILIAFTNTTTYKNALSTFRSLNEEGKEAFNTCMNVNNICYMYDYLIHDTQDSHRGGKYLYTASNRITGNNFDISNYKQITTDQKNAMRRELGIYITKKGHTNFVDFYKDIVNNFAPEYENIVGMYSNFFDHLIKGNWHKKINGSKYILADATTNKYVTEDGRQIS